MFKSILDDVKRQFSYGNMVTRLIILNVAVFIFINLLWIILYHGNAGIVPKFYTDFIHFFAISSGFWQIITHPWSIITNMFMHEGFWHILWNMLFLYWFGRIVGDLIGDRHILPLYILGGIAGVVAFVGSANLLEYSYGGGGPYYALGASAGVMAIVVASGFLAPEYNIRLLFLGDVKLKWIVAAIVFIDLVGTAGNINTGGHFAHLGGAFLGWYFVTQLQTGNDLSKPVNGVFERISEFFDNLSGRVKGKPNRPKVVYRNKEKIRKSGGRPNASSDSHDLSHQEKLDAILEKIKKTGYENLTAEEKEFLFNASKKK